MTSNSNGAGLSIQNTAASGNTWFFSADASGSADAGCFSYSDGNNNVNPFDVCGSNKTIGVLAGGAIGFSTAVSFVSNIYGAKISEASAGVLQIGTSSNNALGSLNLTNLTASGTVTLSTLTTPADNATCTAGTIWVDTGFIYVCTASGTVKRATLATF